MSAPALVRSILADGIVPADDSERAELEAVGAIARGDARVAAPDIDVLASALLRRLAEAEADIARYERAWDLERLALDTRYRTLLEGPRSHEAMLRSAIATLAAQADFGPAKSRRVGFGTYGRRTVPAKVTIADAAALLAWARDHLPAAVRQTVKEDVPHKRVAAHLDATGELPPGCEYTPAHEECYAKADPIIGGTR